jgi:hypothetical protein
MRNAMTRLTAALLVLALAGAVSAKEDCMSLTIQEAKAKHESRVMAIPGVVSVGIGLDAQGNPIIVVGLDGPRPETVEKLPATLEGYPVQWRIVGPVKAQDR